MISNLELLKESVAFSERVYKGELLNCKKADEVLKPGDLIRIHFISGAIVVCEFGKFAGFPRAFIWVNGFSEFARVVFNVSDIDKIEFLSRG